MTKILSRIKNNKLLIIIILIIAFLTFISFKQYFKEYFGDEEYYYEMLKKCEDDSESRDCKFFENYESPMSRMERLHTISLASEVIEMYSFTLLQFLGPLLIIIASTATVHKEINSGMIKNYMTRMNYKTYLKKIYLTGVKYSWIFPLTIIVIVLISAYITNFNFVIDDITKEITYYSDYRYNNYFIYTVSTCAALILHSIFYTNLGLISCKKNSNFLVSIVSSYMLFMVINIVSYVLVGGIIFQKLLGINDLGDYFNLTGYWFFRGKPNYFVLFSVSLLLVIFSYIILYLVYKKKEEVLMENEKNN